MVRLPTNRAPIHPGEILLHEFLEPHGLSQSALAKRIGISFVRVNEIVNGKRGVTADTALRLARCFGTSPEVWLNLQVACDLYQALHSKAAAKIEKIKPLHAA
jgi:addiction module HigA family antidote